MKKNKILMLLIISILSLCFLVSCSGEPQAQIKLNKTDILLNVDYFASLELMEGDFVLTENVSWSTSNPKIATVDNGIILARKVGECVVSALYAGKSYDCNVVVTKENNYTLERTEANVEVNRSIKVNVFNNGNIVTYGVEWASENENIATVSNGLITGVSEGSTIVYATIEDKSLSINVTVDKEFIVVGTFEAIKRVDAMNKTFVFNMEFKANGTFKYTRLDNTSPIAFGKYTYENKVLVLTYKDKKIILDVLDENTIKTRGKIETGGMDSVLTFTRNK